MPRPVFVIGVISSLTFFTYCGVLIRLGFIYALSSVLNFGVNAAIFPDVLANAFGSFLMGILSLMLRRVSSW
jgi:hypothetical protein